MTPKSGKKCSSVQPTQPDEAIAADDADPGKVATVKVEQIKAKKGKYGAVPVKPFKPQTIDENTTSNDENEPEQPKEKKSWIEIELVDEEGKPVPGKKYEITLPDKTVAKGTLDIKGFARIDGFEPGICQINFPELDQTAWSKTG